MTNKQILEYIIDEKAQGNSFQAMNTRMKIMFKGVNVKGILEDGAPDDPALNAELIEIGTEFEVDMSRFM